MQHYKMYGGSGDDTFWNQESGNNKKWIKVNDFNDSGDKISLFNSNSRYQVVTQNNNPVIQRKVCAAGLGGLEVCQTTWYNDVVVEGGRKGEILKADALSNSNLFIKR